MPTLLCRCIKPNAQSQPGSLAPPYVLEQLRAGGVLEAVRIACAGFPTRKPFRLALPSVAASARVKPSGCLWRCIPGLLNSLRSALQCQSTGLALSLSLQFGRSLSDHVPLHGAHL